MTPGDRLYDPVRDKQWSSEVYQKAKQAIEETLSARGGRVEFPVICEAVKQKYPSLCDDSIKDRIYPKLPYWKHRVASAIQALKKQGKVYKADHGWVSDVVKPPPPPPPTDSEKLVKEIGQLIQKLAGLAKKAREEGPRPSHDEVVNMVKELGEMLGKTAQDKWGPVFKHDCVWKDNPYANPKLVVEVCDKGNLDKDIASLVWAVRTWGAKAILVTFEQSDFQAAQRKLAPESQIYPLKVDNVLQLHSLLKGGNLQAVRSIFGI